MKIFNTNKNKEFRKNLRRNQTDAEKKIWSRLRNKQFYGLKFHRQYGIGQYIADFYCPKMRLAIEVDGGQHYEEKGKVADKKRAEYFAQMKIKLLRFNNIETLKNNDEVLDELSKNITPPAPL